MSILRYRPGGKPNHLTFSTPFGFGLGIQAGYSVVRCGPHAREFQSDWTCREGCGTVRPSVLPMIVQDGSIWWEYGDEQPGIVFSTYVSNEEWLEKILEVLVRLLQAYGRLQRRPI